MLGGVAGVGRGNPATGESAHNFGAMSAPPHINTQVTRETAMRVCTAEEHTAGHGWAASRDGYAQSPVVPNSVWMHRRNEALLTKERAKERARQIMGHSDCATTVELAVVALDQVTL